MVMIGTHLSMPTSPTTSNGVPVAFLGAMGEVTTIGSTSSSTGDPLSIYTGTGLAMGDAYDRRSDTGRQQ
jgi:hypothetical protein